VKASNSSKLPVVSVVARSDTGKTTFLEALLPALKGMGVRVAVVKHHHHTSSFDTPGKDTFRLAEAGADLVVGVSPHGLRRWFISACRNASARREVIELMTHNAKGEVIDAYTSWEWSTLCDEISKLELDLHPTKLVVLPLAKRETLFGHRELPLGRGCPS
jgi:integrase